MATIIDEYYNTYCMGQNDALKEYYGNPWPFDNTYEGANQFSGVYRTYYFASLSYRDFGFEGKRGTYSTIMYDDENKAEWDAQRKHYYMYLIGETMETTVKIKTQLNENIDVSNLGMYVIDPEKGELVYDKDGVMGNLEAMQNQEMTQAVNNLIGDTVKLVADGYAAYMKAQDLDSKNTDFEKEIKNIVGGFATALKQISKAWTDNEINKCKNEILKTQRKYIANSILKARADVIQYLNDIYMGKRTEYVNVATDKNFVAAVQEYIAEYNKAMASAESIEDIVKDLSLQEDSVQDEVVLSSEELLRISAEIASEQLIDSVSENIEDSVKEWVKDQKWDKTAESAVEKVFGVIITAFKEALDNVIDNIIDAHIKGEAASLAFDWDDFCKAMLQKILDGLVEFYKDGIEEALSNSPKNKEGPYKALIAIIKLVKLSVDKGFDVADGKWDDDAFKEAILLIKDILDVFLKDMLDSYVGSMYWVDNRVSGWINPDKINEYFDIGKELVGDVYNTAKSLAIVADEAMEDSADEKQVSYQALMMYLSYQASYPLENDIYKNIIKLKMGMNPGMRLYDIVMDENKFTHEEIDKCISRIMMQVRIDLTGMKHLITIINITDQKWNTRYFNFMLKQMRKFKDKRWEGLFEIEKLTEYQHLMVTYNDRWESIKKSVSNY